MTERSPTGYLEKKYKTKYIVYVYTQQQCNVETTSHQRSIQYSNSNRLLKEITPEKNHRNINKATQGIT